MIRFSVTLCQKHNKNDIGIQRNKLMIDIEIRGREGWIERNRVREIKREREQSLPNFYELGYMSLA